MPYKQSHQGFLVHQATGRANKTHGHYRGDKESPTMTSWRRMINRCLNDRAHNYVYYGGKGITVCTRWLKFERFLEDMGIRPKGKTLDRIDVNGNYEPNNVRWATILQ